MLTICSERLAAGALLHRSYNCGTMGITGRCNCAGGADRLDEFKRVVDLPTLKATGGAISFKGFSSGELWIALVTFLYVDFLDTTGTLFSMASFINNYVPGVLSALPLSNCRIGDLTFGELGRLRACSGRHNEDLVSALSMLHTKRLIEARTGCLTGVHQCKIPVRYERL